MPSFFLLIALVFRAINQRINEVEKLVALDLRAMERNDESRYGSAAGGAA